jgi:hypothetical protein
VVRGDAVVTFAVAREARTVGTLALVMELVAMEMMVGVLREEDCGTPSDGINSPRFCCCSSCCSCNNNRRKKIIIISTI